ncbi:MAG: siderophore-interacting protein [Pseudomonadota bacterium]
MSTVGTQPATTPSVEELEAYTREMESAFEEVIEHFNGSHSDSIAFIAQQAISHGCVTDAQFIDLAPQKISLEVKTDSGVSSITLPFSAIVTDLESLQGQLMGLLTAARLKAGARTPLTSIEKELRHNATLQTYVSEVKSTRMITPNLVQVTLYGGLEDFVYPGWDAFVYLMVPTNPEDQLPDDFTFADFRAQNSQSEFSRFSGAYYTIRHWRPDEIDIWFVLHGHAGRLCEWAQTARVGDQIALWGPRTAFKTPEPGQSLILIADETAMPAAFSIAEQLDPGHDVKLIVLAKHLPESRAQGLPDNIEFTWIEQGDSYPEAYAQISQAIAALSVDPANLRVWGAGESRQISQLRKQLKRDWGLSNQHIHLTGYWRDH